MTADTTPLTLTVVGGRSYPVESAHVLMLYDGAWVLDAFVPAAWVREYGMPTGRCVVVLGDSLMLVGDVDASRSGPCGSEKVAIKVVSEACDAPKAVNVQCAN